jgi:hypothetical protein
MKHELRRVHPLRAANVGALVYGLVMGVLALIAFPFLLLFAMFAPPGASGAGGIGFAVFFILLYPVMGLVMGWISGLLTSAVYNFIVRWTGGLLFEVDCETASPSDAAVSTC